MGGKLLIINKLAAVAIDGRGYGLNFPVVFGPKGPQGSPPSLLVHSLPLMHLWAKLSTFF